MTIPKKLPDSVDALRQAWQTMRSRGDAGPYDVDLARQALAVGTPSLAYDIAAWALHSQPENTELLYVGALALARLGSTQSASRLCDRLLQCIDDHDELASDALSLAGRLCKDRFAKLTDVGDRQRAVVQGAEYYSRAYAICGDPYPGINAATMAWLSGDGRTASTTAQRVLCACLEAEEEDSDPDHWRAATIAEAYLIGGDRERAAEWYAKARTRAGKALGDVASMRRQLVLLAARHDISDDIWESVRLPVVVTFTGHMLDAPNRPMPRFPPRLESAVYAAIVDALQELDAGFGYTSAACGADILFGEAMLARGAEVHITLPFELSDFLETSVRFAGEQWVERCHRLIEHATHVRYATQEGYLGDDVLFAYTADLIQGAAVLRAEQLCTGCAMLAVVEASGPTVVGGGLETLQRWRGTRARTEIIDLAAIRERTSEPLVPALPPSGRARHRAQGAHQPGPLSSAGTRVVRTMLFADVVGFSKLREIQTSAFFQAFLGEVANLILGAEPGPEFANTWGDGLFLVFKEPVAAADFALKLSDVVRHVDWEARGLPADMNLRIGIHSGPVFEHEDPILKRHNFFGSQVTRTARIEPVAEPGSVFLSEQTANLLVASGSDRFVCEYLGITDMAKGYGREPLYRLRRTTALE